MSEYRPDLSDYEIDSFPADKSLIYSLALGVSKKPSDFNININNYDTAYSYNGWFIWYLLFFDNNNKNAFHNSMNNSFGSSYDSSGYGGGGFSGGGGGGAGGGGAGGF